MDASAENSKPPQKKRRRSRFRSASGEPRKPISVPNNSNHEIRDQGQNNAAPPDVTMPNSTVAALRSRFSQPPTSTTTLGTEAPAKRRRTGPSRFSKPAPSLPPPPSTKPPSKPSTLSVTSIPVQPFSTLKINQRRQMDSQVASVLHVSQADLLQTDPSQNPYYDPAIRLPGRTRAPRPEFNFVEKNDIVAKAEQQRAKAKVHAVQEAYRAELREHASQDNPLPVLPPLAEDLFLDNALSKIPEWEWWDMPFVQPVSASETGQTENGDTSIVLREKRITHYIHHPPPIKPAIAPRPPPVLPLMLTKKESKKLRRQRRLEAHKEQQEMIAAGLLPPPPPKVKLSNMMRVLANETTADPTKMDAEVRAQVEERRRKHEADNIAKKKTKEERREKAVAKIKSDKDAGIFAAVFRVGSMRNPQHRFKVGINARQLGMTGTLVLAKGFCIVVVEGGAGTLRKFKKLMLRRINWEEEGVADTSMEGNSRDAEDDIEDNNVTNSCLLVWEGAISKATFDSFQAVTLKNDSSCRHHFKRHSVEHFWDLCVQATPLGNENIGLREIE